MARESDDGSHGRNSDRHGSHQFPGAVFEFLKNRRFSRARMRFHIELGSKPISSLRARASSDARQKNTRFVMEQITCEQKQQPAQAVAETCRASQRAVRSRRASSRRAPV